MVHGWWWPISATTDDAIGEPEAIDEAPAGRGPRRARAMGWPQGMSVSRGCELMDIARSTYYVQPATRLDDTA